MELFLNSYTHSYKRGNSNLVFIDTKMRAQLKELEKYPKFLTEKPGTDNSSALKYASTNSSVNLSTRP